MGLLYADANSCNIIYREMQLLSSFTYLPLARVGRLFYLIRYDKFAISFNADSEL